MADPRTSLPVGQWKRTRSRVRQTGPEMPVEFSLFADDDATGDRVHASVVIGDLTDYTLEDWGLPAALPIDRVWYLARIVPRTEKARGGTKAVVRFLGRLADKASVWVTTEVKTGSKSRDVVLMRLLSTHGGFESSDPEYAEMMIRRPSSSGPSSGGATTGSPPMTNKIVIRTDCGICGADPRTGECGKKPGVGWAGTCGHRDKAGTVCGKTADLVCKKDPKNTSIWRCYDHATFP